MIVAIRAWYDQRSLREQRLVMAMTALALLLLVYLVLVTPLTNAYRNALERELAAVDRNGRVKLLAERAKSGSRPAPTVADLNLFLIDNARQNGLTIVADRGSEPVSSVVKIEQTSPSGVFAWTRQLEAQGYRIERLRISPVAEGQVSVEMDVRGGAQ